MSMKMLVMGIDGGDLDIIKQFNMPFTLDLISKNKSFVLEEDLFDRGWVKILTGKKGVDTGAFYMYPKLDGSFSFTTSFNTKSLESDRKTQLLWDMLEEMGRTYCIMNVPTTTPVPTKLKKGVVIGSAGGGLNAIDGIPENLVSRDDIREMLLADKYIVDIRIPNNEITETSDLFEQLIQMEKKRTSCFIKICKKENVEFGFLVDRGTTIVQYLARNIIEKIKIDGRDAISQSDDAWALEFLDKYYQALDENIQNIFEELEPDSFMITADHNTVPHQVKASVEPFLMKSGFLYKSAQTQSFDYIKRFIKNMGLLPLAKIILRSKPNSDLIPKPRFDEDRTVAFGSNYVSGIYINDYRFSNVINTNDLYDELLKEIITLFNNLTENERSGMLAVPYRVSKSGKFEDFLPDIIFTNSEGVHFDDFGPSFSYPNKNYSAKLPRKMSKVKHAAHSGDKGRNPILILSNNFESIVPSDKVYDLTLVYELIYEFFKNDSY